MSPDISPGMILRAIGERFLGPEKPKSSTEFVFPNSPHFQQYYTPEFFRAIDHELAPRLQATVEDYLNRVGSPIVEIHQSTDHSAKLASDRGEIHISTSSAATIARDRLFDPDIQMLRRTVLVTSIDQILAAYYGKDMFLDSDFNGQKFQRDGQLTTILDNLANLREGDSFQLIAKDREVEVRVLPLPSDESFPIPKLCLIGPSESDFTKTMISAPKSSKRVLFEMKRNQLELGLAYLAKYNPSRVITSGVSPSGYLISEMDQTRYSDELPPVEKGKLEFLVHAREGNADGFVRTTKNNLRREKDVTGVFGVDVVQTGTSLRQNRLKALEPILPIPCYPVMLKVA